MRDTRSGRKIEKRQKREKLKQKRRGKLLTKRRGMWKSQKIKKEEIREKRV